MEDSLDRSLRGKTIKRILISAGEGTLVFETDQGEVIWKTYGECCSETWFADFINVGALLAGYPIRWVEDIEIPPSIDARSRQDHDAFYGLRIYPVSGIPAELVYRCSSNGYYGGEARVVERRGPGPFREITADWSAPGSG